MSPTMAGYEDAGFTGLLTIEEAAKRCFVERLRGGTVVFTNGVFDVLHRGHLEYLKEASELGTMLIVGVNTDDSVRRLKGPSRPINSEDDRAHSLNALRFVNHVVLFDDDTPEKLILSLNPHILVKGGDYQIETIAGYRHVMQNGGRVLVLPFRKGYSTTGLIERITERHG